MREDTMLTLDDLMRKAEGKLKVYQTFRLQAR